MANHRMHLVLPLTAWEDLKVVADRHHLTPSAYVRQLLQFALAEELNAKPKPCSSSPSS